MRFNVIRYLIGEGLSNVFKNKKSTISSLVIMCATMLIFGLFFVIGENINAFVSNVKEAQELRVFVVNDATDEQIKKVGKDLLEIEGVKDAVYISKEEGLESMRDVLGEELIEGYKERNILSAAYDVTLTDLELNKEVQENIQKIENVKKVEASNKVIDQILRLAKGIKIVTGAILLLLIIISISIISNTIKLTVHARRKEISIMKYVGATNSFIRWPFMVEGILIGMVAGLISVALIGIAYTVIANKIAETEFMQMIKWQLLNFNDMFNLILVVYLGLGIGIGIVGSRISMKKYLEV